MRKGLAKDLMDNAKRAIDSVFSDTSVPSSETRERLEELQDQITDYINTLDK